MESEKPKSKSINSNAELFYGFHEHRDLFRDEKGNKEFQFNPLFWKGKIWEPVNDRVLLLKNGNSPIITWPRGHRFAACLTHDVDKVSKLDFKQEIRRFWSEPKTLLGLGKSLKKVFKAVLFGFERQLDPFEQFEKWMSLEEKYGARSTFFFLPETPTWYHKRDNYYRYHDKVRFAGEKISVADLMNALDKGGWEVGLHGSYSSFNDPIEMRKQKGQIEKVLGHEITSFRQHNLLFDVARSPLAIAQGGFKYDSTPGFNRMIGFRFGTSYPHFYKDLTTSKQLALMHIPLHIQDSALMKSRNLGLPADYALNICKAVIDEVQEVGGVITILWHSNVLDNSLYPGWVSLYTELINYLKESNAWLTTVRNIGEWCGESAEKIEMLWNQK